MSDIKRFPNLNTERLKNQCSQFKEIDGRLHVFVDGEWMKIGNRDDEMDGLRKENKVLRDKMNNFAYQLGICPYCEEIATNKSGILSCRNLQCSEEF